jgi:MarR family transcriptional regulator, 2-MHQ and catechol-resistance regulon repressor
VSDISVDDQRITAVGLLSEVYSGLTSRFAAQIAEHGLAFIEFEVLIRLSRSPEGRLRMTDLSTQTSLTSSGVTRVVDRLERDGLVERTACPSDRRSSHAVITEAGRCRLDAVLPDHLDLIDRWFTGLLPPEQMATLLSGLRVIRDAVRPGATAGAAGSSATDVLAPGPSAADSSRTATPDGPDAARHPDVTLAR